MTPATIAIAMRQQAQSAGLSHRQLPGGLVLRFSRSGPSRSLVLMRRQPGPSVAEREQWREAFRVPLLGVFEYRGLEGEYILVQYEWSEK